MKKNKSPIMLAFILISVFILNSTQAANNPDARFLGGSYDGYARSEATSTTLQLPMGTMISIQ